MKIDFNRGVLEIEDARIIYRNFGGVATKYNREGDRNFAVIIPNDEIKDELIENGWNVKIKPPREEDDSPFMFLPVKIKFNNRGPAVYIESGDSMQKLNEGLVMTWSRNGFRMNRDSLGIGIVGIRLGIDLSQIVPADVADEKAAGNILLTLRLRDRKVLTILQVLLQRVRSINGQITGLEETWVHGAVLAYGHIVGIRMEVPCPSGVSSSLGTPV